ncbi:Mobile element protein [hydrothermal vent metagenome]|uniref:Mobile element protein n=1 Tax=hydrothermal vent metagenome TaxID=652676 RepID=A0A3B0V7I6_9ZZZZ
MKFKEALGIDVSKKTIDVILHLNSNYHQFENNVKGYKSLLRWVKKQTGLSPGEVLICFEHTGLYSLPLAIFLNEQEILFSMVAALEIKRSLGIVRGKNDKIDAKRIAEYAYLRISQLKPFKLPSTNILRLQKLLSLRERMVKQRAGYMGSIKEYKCMLKQKDYESLFTVHKKMIHYLSKQIDTMEKETLELIEGDEEMSVLYHLMISIKGVGPILASNLLVVTNCFMGFSDGRKFACYAGIAPFEKQSGTSLNIKARVSHFANKKIKSLLNLSASSAIQADPELKAYYQRRVENGKSKMSTLNIVRNKIVHRIFAVIKRGTPYVPLYQHAA